MPTAIEQLIPHRAPMRWVEELIDCTDTTATATTRFTAEHFAVAHSSPGTPSSLSPPKGGEGRGEEAQLLAAQIPSPQPSPRPSGERESGRVFETTLVECMAQTVAAALGHRLRASGPSPGAANNGMLAAVSNFKIHSHPPLDKTLTIEVREVKRLGPMLLIAGKISCDAELIATGDLSLYA